MLSLLPLFLAGFALLMLTAAFYDAATMTIPNWIPGTLMVLFFMAAPLAGLSWPAIGLHMLAGFGALAFVIVMFAFGWIGGGDAKLFAAAALWMGWPAVLMFAAWAAMAGGVLTLFLLTVRQYPMPVQLVSWQWSSRLLKKGGDVPYGIGLCAGALVAFPQTPVFLAAISG